MIRLMSEAYIILILLIQIIQSKIGLDISIKEKELTQQQWECFVEENFEFGIIQIWSGSQGLNEYAINNIQNAKKAGINTIEIQIFCGVSCCGNSDYTAPINQVQKLLKDIDIQINRLWFQVVQCSRCWLTQEENLKFIERQVAYAQEKGFQVGIYSKLMFWDQVMGKVQSSFLKQFPLWYGHHDMLYDFSDTTYYNFGGWTEPMVKQVSERKNICGADVHINWLP